MKRKSRAKPYSPFRCFNALPEVIRLVVMMYVRFPLSLRNVEDLPRMALTRCRRMSLANNGPNRFHQNLTVSWQRSMPLSNSVRQWRWHLDEVYVKINGEMHYLVAVSRMRTCLWMTR